MVAEDVEAINDNKHVKLDSTDSLDITIIKDGIFYAYLKGTIHGGWITFKKEPDILAEAAVQQCL